MLHLPISCVCDDNDNDENDDDNDNDDDDNCYISPDPALRLWSGEAEVGDVLRELGPVLEVNTLL